MLGTILIVILILALLGALPRWSHSREWGYAPTGGLGLVLCIIVTFGRAWPDLSDVHEHNITRRHRREELAPALFRPAAVLLVVLASVTAACLHIPFSRTRKLWTWCGPTKFVRFY